MPKLRNFPLGNYTPQLSFPGEVNRTKCPRKEPPKGEGDGRSAHIQSPRFDPAKFAPYGLHVRDPPLRVYEIPALAP